MFAEATLLKAAAVITLLAGLLGLLGALAAWRRSDVHQLSGGQQIVLFLFATANLALIVHAVLLLISYPLDLLTLGGNVIAVVLLRLLNGLFVTGLRWQAQVLNLGLGIAVLALAWYGGLEIPDWVDLPAWVPLSR